MRDSMEYLRLSVEFRLRRTRAGNERTRALVRRSYQQLEESYKILRVGRPAASETDLLEMNGRRAPAAE
jgi:hypothetical protein